MNGTDITIIENSVSLLLKFLNYYDGRTEDTDESSLYLNNPVCTVMVKDMDEDVTKEI